MDNSPAVKKVRVVVMLGMAQTVSWASSYYLPAILTRPVAQEMGQPPHLVMLTFTVALVIMALLGPVIGRRVDRWGGRNILLLSHLVLAAGLVGLSQAGSMITLFLAWGVIGLGMSLGLYDAAFAALVRIFGAQARGPITGVTLIAGFASTISWPLTAWLESRYGWRGACLVWAGVQLGLAMPLIWTFLPRGSVQAAALTEEEDARPHHPATLPLLAAAFFCTTFITGAAGAYLPELLQASGVSVAQALFLVTLVGPAQVGARLMEFGVLRRLHPLPLSIFANLAFPLGVGVFLAMGAGAAAVFVVLYGVGNGIMTIVRGTLPLALFGPRGYGFRQGVINMPARFAQAGAPFLLGVIYEHFGVHTALVILGVLGGLSAGLLFVLGRLSRTSKP